MKKVKSVNDAYVERDVSWMYFNHRILDEACKQEVPLLERLSFLGIYSNNLDEFFRVRVANLNRMLEDESLSKRNAERIKRTIKIINHLNKEYSEEYQRANDEVFAQLGEKGIHVINEEQLTKEQKSFLQAYYYDKLNGLTNPIWLQEVGNIGSLEDNRIYLLVEKTEIESGKTKYALIKVPDKAAGSFIVLPQDEEHSADTYVIYLDDVIRHCLPFIFAGFPPSVYRAYSFKFTKDAEMEMEGDIDDSTMEKVAQGISSRKHGNPIRLVFDDDMPKGMRRRIFDRLNISELSTTLGGGRYQNHKDLMKFPSCGRTDLSYPKWKPVMKPEFMTQDSVLNLIRQKDRFLHVPYQSFNGYIRLLREAALSPDVKEIKTTLYRLAKDSKVVKALICAAQNGKKVTAVVELFARFDEESNINWSKRMEENGVNVIFGVDGLKIHSKLLLIHCKRGADIACIGTGNFHEGNAALYTDYLQMTARPGIVGEVAKVFSFIDRPFSPVRFMQLLVSPNAMKTRIIRLIDNEIKNAQAGKEAWMKVKINHITDPDMVRKLYQASQAGVRVELLVRGNCSVVPGIAGLSENIHAVAIIDRYLEHARALIFANGGKPKYYLGSADWMPRNLISRIEVMAPVLDPDIQADVLRTVDYGLRDTTNARLIDGLGSGNIQPGKPFRSQLELHNIYNNVQSPSAV